MFKLTIEFKDGKKLTIRNVTDYDWNEVIGLLSYYKDKEWNYDTRIEDIAKFEVQEVNEY